ncbi:MAG: hypothetical protein PHG41_05415 [Actinomycetota bacterium]|nr:hypothetical protein [Actinomycetota bacterium]
MSKAKLLITGIVSILAFFIISSCAPVVEKVDVEREGTSSEETGNTLEEGAQEPEDFEVVDYENAVIGAEITGYIPSYLCTDADNYVKIQITNTSDFTWKCSGKDRVCIGYHYYGQNVDYSDYDKTARTLLPDNLRPGETTTVEVLINDITHEGFYVIQIDLVLEGHFWFSSKGVPVLEGKTYFGSCAE